MSMGSRGSQSDLDEPSARAPNTWWTRWEEFWQADEGIVKAMARGLLERAVAQTLVVQLYGHGKTKDSGVSWWCRKPILHKSRGQELRKNTTWLQIDDRHLHLMAASFDSWALHTPVSMYAPNEQVEYTAFDARRWRRVRPDDLNNLAGGRIRQLDSTRFSQQQVRAPLRR